MKNIFCWDNEHGLPKMLTNHYVIKNIFCWENKHDFPKNIKKALHY